MSVGTWSSLFFPYTEAVVRRNAPTNGGVYLLWVHYKSGKWAPFYVGKAEDLQSRLLDHLQPNEPNECIKENVSKYKCGFMWIEISTERERAGAEKFIYNKLKPECNKNDPGGTPVGIPLPPQPPATPASS